MTLGFLTPEGSQTLAGGRSVDHRKRDGQWLCIRPLTGSQTLAGGVAKQHHRKRRAIPQTIDPGGVAAICDPSGVEYKSIRHPASGGRRCLDHRLMSGTPSGSTNVWDPFGVHDTTGQCLMSGTPLRSRISSSTPDHIQCRLREGAISIPRWLSSDDGVLPDWRCSASLPCVPLGLP